MPLFEWLAGRAKFIQYENQRKTHEKVVPSSLRLSHVANYFYIRDYTNTSKAVPHISCGSDPRRDKSVWDKSRI